MRVSKLNSPNRLVLLNISKHRIDWDDDGSSSLETRFRDLIKPFWGNDVVLFQTMIPGSKLRIDFLNLTRKIAVETSGNQHFKFNKHFHSNSRAVYLASMKRDMQKQEWLRREGFKFIELIEKDLDLFSLDYIYETFGVDLV